jgi:5'-3' exonuclease
MGIKDLNPFLKRHGIVPEKVSLNSFRGKRAVIDSAYIVHTWMFQNAMEAMVNADFVENFIDFPYFLELVLTSAKRFLRELLEAGIYPIFVRDNPIAPEEKIFTLEERRAKKADAEAHYQVLLDKFLKADPLSEDNNIDLLKEVYLKTNYLTSSQWEKMMDKIFSLGIPQVMVKPGYDGERLVAALVREGEADVAWTTDTDVLVHGAHTVITGFVSGKNTLVKVMRLEPILNIFDDNLEVFRDFCIICGCDYNKRIYGIGPVKCYNELLDVKGDIDLLIRQYKPHSKNWNYKVCVKMFELISSDDLILEETMQPDFVKSKLPRELRKYIRN